MRNTTASHSYENQVLTQNARNSRNELSHEQIKLLEFVDNTNAQSISLSLKSIFELSAFNTGDAFVSPELRDDLFVLYQLIPLIEGIGKGGNHDR